MNITSLNIEKIGVGTWILNINNTPILESGEAEYTGGYHDLNYVNIKTLNGSLIIKNIPFSIISYTDNIDGTNTRASFPSTQAFLLHAKATGFFPERGSGSGSATSFDALTDTPDSKTGNAGKAVVVSQGETTLEYLDIPIVNDSTDLDDFPGQRIEGKYLKVVNGVYTLVDAIEGQQNNIGLKRSYGSTEVAPTTAQMVAALNSSSLVVSEQQTPVIVYKISLEGVGESTDVRIPAKVYSWLFLAGKGSYGSTGTSVTSSMLFMLPVANLTPADIENDPDSVTYNLDPVTDGDYIGKANTSFWDFTDSTYPEPGKNYYFSYTDDGVLYYALFVGTPGTYGTGGTPFTESDFITTTDSNTPDIDDSDYARRSIENTFTADNEFIGDTSFQGGVTASGSVDFTAATTFIKDAISNNNPVALGQLNTILGDYATKVYVDGLVMGILRLAGNWDASGGTYPTTGTGTGGAVRRGDSYIVTVSGTINGQLYGVGDSFYALVNNPGQTPANWGRFEVPSGQATDVMAGILLLFGSTGISTIGTMTQKAITDALALKANTDGSNVVPGSNWNINSASTSMFGGRSANFSGFGGLLAEVVGVDGISGDIQRYTQTQVSAFLTDVVHKTGAETIAGVKTFTDDISVSGGVTAGASISSFSDVSAPLGLFVNARVSTAPVNTTDVVRKQELDLKANISSPALTGTPTAPTAGTSTNNNQLATTAFVKNAIASGRGYAYKNQTSNITLVASDFGDNGVCVIFADATSAAFTITLPTTAIMSLKTVEVVKIDSSANAVTIKGDGSININAANTYLLTAQFQNVSVKTNATQYYIV